MRPPIKSKRKSVNNRFVLTCGKISMWLCSDFVERRPHFWDVFLAILLQVMCQKALRYALVLYKMFAVLKMLIFFALICCPLTALYASGPKMLYKIMLKKYQSLWKCPIGLHIVFLCVCVNLKQTSWRHSPPPYLSKPAQQVFTLPCDVLVAWKYIARPTKPPFLQA